jgi:hypothetical protein
MTKTALEDFRGLFDSVVERNQIIIFDIDRFFSINDDI